MDEFDSVQYYDDRYYDDRYYDDRYYDDRFSISEEELFYDSVHNAVLCDVMFKNKYNI